MSNNAMNLNEQLANALGIDTSKNNVQSVSLVLRGRDAPLLRVEYAVVDADIPAIATAIVDYELRRKAPEITMHDYSIGGPVEAGKVYIV